MIALADDKVSRSALSCGNIAHAMASCSDAEKQDLTGEQKVNMELLLLTMTCFLHIKLMRIIQNQFVIVL